MDRKNFLRTLTGISLLGLTSKAHSASTAGQSFCDVRLFGAKGDGKSDDTKAFAKALSTHGEAYVPEGVFCLSELLLQGQQISGVGTLKAFNQKDVIQVSGKGAKIFGLKFATTNSRTKCEIRILEGAQEVSISQCHFEGKAYSVVSADQNGQDDTSLKYKTVAKRILFTGNFVRGYVSPLYFHSVHELIIQNNFFCDTFYDAIRLRQNIERAIISDNHFENIGTSSEEVSRDAIDTFWSGRELIISGNVIKKTGCMGFDLKGHEPKMNYVTQNVLVTNNYIEGTNYSGILLSSGGAPKNLKAPLVGPYSIQGNTIVGGNRKNNSQFDAAIWVHHGVGNVQINGNMISGHNGHGISLTNAFPGAAKLKSFQVNNNKISDCHHQGKAAGIFFQQVEYLQIQNNFVEKCDYTWDLEKISDPVAFKKGLQIEQNFFVGPSNATPSTDWSVFVGNKNHVIN